MVPTQSTWSLYWLARHKPYWIVLLSGLLLAGSFPPSPLNFLIFVAFVPLFVLFETEVVPEKVPEDKVFRPFKSSFTVFLRVITLQFLWRRETRFQRVFTYRRKLISGNAQLFRYTYTIFLLWNIGCCYWLFLTVLGARSPEEVMVYGTAGILAITLNPALMSIPFQFFSRIRWILPPTLAVLSFIVFWITFEYLHLNWDLSWSWLNLGHALTPWPSWIQYAEFTGVLGVTLHILLANFFIYLFYRRLTYQRKMVGLSLGIALFWLCLPFLLNLVILDPDRAVFQSEGTITVRVVQPNIDPFLKRNYFTPEEQVKHLVKMSQSQPLDSIDLLVYPETAIPRPVRESSISGSRLMKPFWTLVDSHKVDILTGLESFMSFPDSESAPLTARQTARGEWIENYNAATLLREDREFDVYHKGKLVPMVESIPFRNAFDNLEWLGLDLLSGLNTYGQQEEVVVLATFDEVPIGVMICYDSQFGDLVRKSTLQGAQLLTIVTNDGWWGKSSGYIQHAYFTSLRAIENRRDIARSANTGRSLFADAYGNLYQDTEYSKKAVIDRTLNLYSGETFYVQHGDYLGRIALWMTLVISVLGIGWKYLGRFFKFHRTNGS